MRRITWIVWIFLGAVFLLFAYPPFGQAYLAWCGLLPVFLLASKKNAFLVGGVFGLFFYGLGLLWVTGLSVAGWLVLTVYLALYPAVFFSACRAFSPRAYALKAACLGVTLEFVAGRLFGGFPWFDLALTQHGNHLLLNLVPLGGAGLVSFFLYLVNAALYSYFFLRYRDDALLSLAAVVALLHFSVYSPFPPATPDGPRLRVALVQANVPSSLRRQGPVLEPYLALTRRLAEPVDLIVWPETTFAAYGADAPAAVRVLLAEKNAWLVAGVLEGSGDAWYNSAVLYAPDGRTRGTYRKRHLVPFGEYVPGSRFRLVRRLVERDAGFLPGLAAGDAPARLELPFAALVPLVCYESVFPRLARESVVHARFSAAAMPKPLALTVLSNDSWLGILGGAQHYAAAPFRAAENGAWLLRSANTGVTAVLDDRGRLVDCLPPREAGILVSEVPVVANRLTPWQRFPMATPLACLLFLVSCLPWETGRRRARGAGAAWVRRMV